MLYLHTLWPNSSYTLLNPNPIFFFGRLLSILLIKWLGNIWLVVCLACHTSLLLVCGMILVLVVAVVTPWSQQARTPITFQSITSWSPFLPLPPPPGCLHTFSFHHYQDNTQSHPRPPHTTNFVLLPCSHIFYIYFHSSRKSSAAALGPTSVQHGFGVEITERRSNDGQSTGKWNDLYVTLF